MSNSVQAFSNNSCDSRNSLRRALRIYNSRHFDSVLHHCNEGIRGMKKQKNETKRMFKRYILDRYIDSLKELADMAGIEYRTFLQRMENPGLFRAYELKALDDILHFEDADLFQLIKGG